ncbi:hypothetical protein [Noviherbaspirillum pedocola]|uniref:Uncharacterized protein n=1 Tax=Noviherbaspirillum pedocola TaxID=2801341 RepID=A0A934SS68_9BURK|nr:hypothetical protein [Noviherbaspirillum pedocola]MBK4735615.1 hypothetical protein [Noviherbaspirillum pedocola]
MRQFILPALLMAGLCGCGGGGGDGSSASTGTTPSTASAAAPAYPHSLALGRFAPETISFIDGQPGQGLAIDVSVASALLSAGRNPLAAIHRDTAAAGVIVACVSAPTSATGIVDNINLGVNIRSVAALMDAGWNRVADPASAWSQLAGTHFDNWENCGAKPEGQPSLASRLNIGGDGSWSEEVYDGNFGTNLNTIELRYDASQVAAMLSADGWLNPGIGTGAKRMWLTIWRNAAGTPLLLVQGWPEARGATDGFLAVYFSR